MSPSPNFLLTREIHSSASLSKLKVVDPATEAGLKSGAAPTHPTSRMNVASSATLK